MDWIWFSGNRSAALHSVRRYRHFWHKDDKSYRIRCVDTPGRIRLR